MRNSTVTVTQHQGIDLDKIEQYFKSNHSDDPEYKDIREDVLELVEHVREDELLDRIAEARQSMAEQDAENILASLP